MEGVGEGEVGGVTGSISTLLVAESMGDLSCRAGRKGANYNVQLHTLGTAGGKPNRRNPRVG